MSNNYKNYYIDGTSVRELQTAPRVPRKDPRVVEEERKKKNRRNAVRRNRERAMNMNFGFVSFLTLCVALCGVAAVSLIHIQSNTTMHMKQIAVVESQLADLRASNAETQKRLNTSIDLNEVKDIAMNELGMTYAREDQIVYYHVDRANYMDQFDNIPN